MNNNTKVEILPEDKIQLTQEQKNLIELAFVKQLPPEDAKFIEKVQKEAKNKVAYDPYSRLSVYYINKYGSDFGMIYLSAIMGGAKKYKQTVNSIEKLKASERIKHQN